MHINQTIDPSVVTLYSHRTGKLIDEIPSERVKDLDHISGGGIQSDPKTDQPD